jgi:hypothetical protein
VRFAGGKYGIGRAFGISICSIESNGSWDRRIHQAIANEQVPAHIAPRYHNHGKILAGYNLFEIELYFLAWQLPNAVFMYSIQV